VNQSFPISLSRRNYWALNEARVVNESNGDASALIQVRQYQDANDGTDVMAVGMLP
jgi:hypothetical protein